MKKAVIFVVLTMVVISFCVAQSANDAQRLVGTWVSEDGRTLVLNANGTGTCSGFNSYYNSSNFDGNIFWGVSISGDLRVNFPNTIWDKLNFYLSPDSKRIIINGTVYQKR